MSDKSRQFLMRNMRVLLLLSVNRKLVTSKLVKGKCRCRRCLAAGGYDQPLPTSTTSLAYGPDSESEPSLRQAHANGKPCRQVRRIIELVAFKYALKTHLFCLASPDGDVFHSFPSTFSVSIFFPFLDNVRRLYSIFWGCKKRLFGLLYSQYKNYCALLTKLVMGTNST